MKFLPIAAIVAPLLALTTPAAMADRGEIVAYHDGTINNCASFELRWADDSVHGYTIMFNQPTLALTVLALDTGSFVHSNIGKTIGVTPGGDAPCGQYGGNVFTAPNYPPRADQ